MNLLAHAHLSFNEPQIVVGNMISDFVKGKKQYDYPALIYKGITLHRAIDNFTDTHQATREIKLIFRPQYRLYAGAFTDVVYDHFLANDTAAFATENHLKDFTAATYNTLRNYSAVLPENFKQMLPHMIEHDWLYNYRFTGGIEQSFKGLVRRAAYLKESDIAFALFNQHYETIKLLYTLFYPQLKMFAAHQLQHLLND